MFSRWKQFWFAPTSTESLAMLRIFFGAVFFMKLTGTTRFFFAETHTMRFPRHFFSSADNYFLSSFRLPVPGFAWLVPPSFEGYRAIESWILIFCVFFTAGYLARWIGPILLALYGYLFVLTQFTYSHHGFLFLIVLAILAFSRCSDHLSVDAYFGAGRHRQLVSAVPIRLIQVLVTTIYLFSCASKLNQGWFGGSVISLLIEDGRLIGVLGPVASMVPARVLSVVVVFLEGFLVLGLWNVRLRHTAILLGLMMHIGIDMMMDVTTFGMQMMVLYIAFIDPVARRTAVFYDGNCSLCVRSMRLIALFDWFRRFAWLDFRNPNVRTLIRCATTEQLESQMMLVRPTGKIDFGFNGWRYILTKLPLTFVPSHFLYLPLISGAGRVLYRLVARSRFGLVHCQPGQCDSVGDHVTSGLKEPWMDSIRIANCR